MKIYRKALLTCCAAFLLCGCSASSEEDEGRSPVLDGQTIHKPGQPNQDDETDKTDTDKGNSDEQDGTDASGDDDETDSGDKDDEVVEPPKPFDTGDGRGDSKDNSGEDSKGDNSGEEVDTTPDDSAVESSVDGVPVLPLTYKPYTTLQVAYMPKIGAGQYSEADVRKLISSHELVVTQKDRYEKYGLGIAQTDGEPWIVRESLLKSTDPDLSHKGKSLAYFWQVSDPQIIDEESPCRMEGVTIYPYVVASAYRPQGIYSTHMFDLHVQTARRISELSTRPFDFALVTGDIADNAQENENGWFMRMMGGGVLDPDTGVDDDPIPGAGNDYNDPFYSNGIGDIPWYPAIGNHDLLYMGFSVYDDRIQSACTGDTVVDLFDYVPIVVEHEYRSGYKNGFIDGSTVDATVVTSGTTPADSHRRLLSKTEALTSFYNAPGLPEGHGLDADTIAAGWGYYSTYPIPGKPIRLITLDTNSGQFSEADMTLDQFNWLSTQIEDARVKNELVIVQSHHGTAKLSGTVTQAKFQALLASYDGVILHITGHGHSNDSNLYMSNNKGYWEVMLASVVDFPSQTRIFEIVHEGNGIIDIYITNVDPNAPKGSFVYTALNYAATRLYFGMSDDPIAAWQSEKEHRNLILRTRVSESIWKNLDAYEWSDVIESEVTLNAFQYHPTL